VREGEREKVRRSDSSGAVQASSRAGGKKENANAWSYLPLAKVRWTREDMSETTERKEESIQISCFAVVSQLDLLLRPIPLNAVAFASVCSS